MYFIKNSRFGLLFGFDWTIIEHEEKNELKKKKGEA